MPRDGSGVYQVQPGTRAAPDTTISSAPYNALINDLVEDANAARPVTAGGTGVTNLTALRALLGSEVGTVSTFAMSEPPTGWLKANGAAVSRTTYAALFTAIGTTFGAGNGNTTFNLPDLRGEFIRGWDDGRGIDASRTLGSAQASQNLSHGHTGSTDSQGNHSHSGTTNTDGAHAHGINSSGAQTRAAGLLWAGVGGNEGAATRTDGAHSHVLSISANGAHTHNVTIAANGGSEARPRNVALLACIKF